MSRASLGRQVMGVLIARGIECVEKGKNVGRGNFAIQCPWCGGEDPSQHLSISLRSGQYHCWRSSLHRGQDPVNIISAVLHCSRSEARRMLGMDPAPSNSDLEAVVAELQQSTKPVPVHDVDLAREFYAFRPVVDTGPGRRFFRYLQKRFGTPERTVKAIDRYSLRYALAGKYKDRIVVPIFEEGKCVAFTARSIHAEADLRYRATESHDDRLSIKSTIFNFNALHEIKYQNRQLSSPHHLVITEGPFDAMNLDLTGSQYGVHSVAVFNTQISTDQAYQIKQLLAVVRSAWVIFDQGFSLDAAVACRQLSSTHVVVRAGEVPAPFKDFGEMSEVDVRRFCSNLLKGKFK